MNENTKNFLQKLVDIIMTFLRGGEKKEESPRTEITHIPQPGEKSKAVEKLQKALSVKGYKLKVDGDFGPITKEKVSEFQRNHGLQGSGIPGPRTIELLNLKIAKKKDAPEKSKTPWFWALKKYEGQNESNPAFNKEMSSYWGRVGLPGFKSIIGSKRAWCGLFICIGLMKVGYDHVDLGFRAKEWDKFGQKINWRVNGFPQGAIIRINGKGNCSSASSNHVTLANGDCTAKDLLKANATFSGFGGNQGNRAKISTYPVRNICSVTWPKEQKLPTKITKSVNCSNGKTSNESTR